MLVKEAEENLKNLTADDTDRGNRVIARDPVIG
jgi:hypothetical protein